MGNNLQGIRGSIHLYKDSECKGRVRSDEYGHSHSLVFI